MPKIQQPREPRPSIINEKTIADFTRVVEQTGILERELSPVPKASPKRQIVPYVWVHLDDDR